MMRAPVPAAELRRRAASLAQRPDAAHLAPLVAAVAEGIGLMVVEPRARSFRFLDERPCVLIIGDDFDASRGPGAFHRPSLRRALRRATHIAVMAGAPVAGVYGAAAVAALLGGYVVLVECQERTKGDWNAFVRKTAPRLAHLIVTPTVGGRA